MRRTAERATLASTSSGDPHWRPAIEPRTLAFAAAFVVLLGAAIVSYLSIDRLSEAGARNQTSNQVVLELERTLSDLRDAQQAERAFILTNNDSFLPPYSSARASLDAHFKVLDGLTASDTARRTQVAALEPHASSVLDLLTQAVLLRQAGNVRQGDLGNLSVASQSALDVVRQDISTFEDSEQTSLATGRANADADATRTLATTSALSAFALLLLTGVYVLLRREIARRRRSEATADAALTESRDLYENAPCGYHSLDAAGRFVSINETELKWLGYAREELVGRQSFQDLLTPESVAKLAEAFPSGAAFHARFPHFKETGEIPELEFEMIRKDGSVLPILVSAVLTMDAAGRYVSSRATVFDITARRSADDQIRALNAELKRHAVEVEATNRELEAFSYSVSHDLRAPLRTIDGFSQALVEDFEAVLDDDGKHLLSRIRAATQRMGQLIDDLLQLSRMTRGDFTREPVDLSALVERTVAELRRVEPERGVEVVIQPHVVADGDSRLLHVVVENLISNAWKYTSKHDSARIEFGLATGSGRQPVYFVRDDGAGFDMSYADKLFGVFQRLHKPSDFNGTGVGLATVQRVVTRHGGRIWAEASVEHGACFFFTLAPAQDEIEEPQQEAA